MQILYGFWSDNWADGSTGLAYVIFPEWMASRYAEEHPHVIVFADKEVSSGNR